jgi:FMN-dependent NADH-azoreductase
MPLVDWAWIDAVYHATDHPTPEGKALLKFSDALVDELYGADEILISTPMYNFGMPTALKGWVDQVVRFNRTFTAQYEGLITGKKLNAIVTSGGNYESGAYYSKMDYCSGHLRAIMAFIGITDTKIYLAGDTHNITQGKISLEDYVAQKAPWHSPPSRVNQSRS